MKTKYTKQNEIDFYYLLLINYSQYQMGFLRDEDFNNNPTNFTNILDKFQRETSPETYEYYVSDIGIKNIRNGYWSLASSKPSDIRINKIKITICEDE